MWSSKWFDELSTSDLYRILQLRSAVFVVEQNCVYQDIDGLDLSCLHLFQSDEKGNVVAYARIIPPGRLYEEVSIGRVVNDTQSRGKGLGRELMIRSMEICRQYYPNVPIKIMAQSYLMKFYQSLGFQVVSEEFLEDGIPHHYMLYTQA